METLLGLIVLGLFINFLSNRIEANLPTISRWLVCFAALFFKNPEKDRLKEEWHAYIDELSGRAKLLQSLQLPYAAAAIRITKLAQTGIQILSLAETLFLPPHRGKGKFISAFATLLFVACSYPVYVFLRLKKVDKKSIFPRFCVMASFRAGTKIISGMADLMSDPNFECTREEREEIWRKGNELLAEMDTWLPEKSKAEVSA